MIPFINFIVGTIGFMDIAGARGKPRILGVLMLLPGLNFLVLGYLAFAP